MASLNVVWTRITGPSPTQAARAPVPFATSSSAQVVPIFGPSPTPLAISRVLSDTLPRQVRYAGLVITINRGEITNRDPGATDPARQYRADQAYAILDTTVKNTETATEVILNIDPVRLQLADGKAYQPTSGWRTFHPPQSSEDARLVFVVPLAATWQGAQFLLSQPNKEPALLPLDGVVPATPTPNTLKEPGQAAVEQILYKVTSVSLDLDWNGTHTDIGKRFMIFAVHLTNNRADAAARNITWGNFRLFVDGEPIAPINTASKFLENTSSADLQYAFVVPANFGKVELQVGEVGRTTARIPIALKAR